MSQYLGIVASVILTVLPGGNKMMGNAIDNFTKQAQEDLEKKAAKLGADAVIGLKFATQGNQLHAAWNRCEAKLGCFSMNLKEIASLACRNLRAFV